MSHDLAPIPEADDLPRLVEELKNALVSVATGGPMDLPERQYQRTRKAMMLHPAIAPLLPEYIQRCRSIQDFWPFIKAKFSTYAERRGYLADTLNPILEHLDGLSGAGLGANYADMGEIGHGGFGVVHRVHNSLLKMDFAVKYFAPVFEGAGGEGHLERFFQEARILLGLRHRSIIQVYDVGVVGSRPYIRMEFFDGQPLGAALRQSGRIPADRAVLLVREVADALGHAHDRGVVHRDVAPRNILVAKPAAFRVIDFGLGVYIEKALTSRLTSGGQAPAGGTYTCPDLAADPKLVDPRCDLFSLAAVWYEMLVGRAPTGAGVERELGGVVGLSRRHQDLLLESLGPRMKRKATARDFVDALA